MFRVFVKKFWRGEGGLGLGFFLVGLGFRVLFWVGLGCRVSGT